MAMVSVDTAHWLRLEIVVLIVCLVIWKDVVAHNNPIKLLLLNQDNNHLCLMYYKKEGV